MTAPTLPSPLLNKMSRFNEEMKAVLENNDIDDDSKASMYSQVLSKYLSARNQYTRPTPVPIVEDEQNRLTDPTSEAIPKTYMKKARFLLDHIRKSPDMGWNSRNELLLDGQRLNNTNIIDLIDELVRPRSLRDPRGIDEFVRALKKDNLPETLVNNRKRWLATEELSPHSSLQSATPQRRTAEKRSTDITSQSATKKHRKKKTTHTSSKSGSGTLHHHNQSPRFHLFKWSR